MNPDAIVCGYSVPHGWDALVRPVIARMQADGVVVEQVKQKLGHLAIYLERGAEYRDDVRERYGLDALYAACRETCEECARPGKPTRRGGYLGTFCGAHADRRSTRWSER